MTQGIENCQVDKELRASRPEDLSSRLNSSSTSSENSKEKFVAQIRWPDLAAQIYIHVGLLYGIYLMFTSAKLATSIFAIATIYTSGFGITAGVHRLWSHRSYKAKWPLRLILVLLFTVTGQRHVYAWALDHRVHHKYCETDADPHDARRGFFFSHVGWLVLTPHPDVVAKREAIDMSDLEEDEIVMWQKKWYPILFFLLAICLPVGIPIYCWNETLWNSFWINFNTRFGLNLNIAFCINSIAHMWGQKPFDRFISSVENAPVSIAALGEGWHNYHHVFPWDYRASELGSTFNPSTILIDSFAKIGWAYDLKQASSRMISNRAKKTGDGSHHVWGFGDADISKEDADELLPPKAEKFE